MGFLGSLGNVLGPIGSAVGIVTGVSSLFGGSKKSKGKQTTERQPAPWESDTQQIWNEFLDRWFGIPATTGNESQDTSAAFIVNQPSSTTGSSGEPAWTTSLGENVIPSYAYPQNQEQAATTITPITGGKSFLDMLRGDEEERKKAEEEFVKKESEITGESQEDIRKALKAYEQEIADIQPTLKKYAKDLADLQKKIGIAQARYNREMIPTRLKLGNFTVNWVPGSQRRAALQNLNAQYAPLLAALPLELRTIQPTLEAAGQNYRTRIGSTSLLQALADAQAQREKDLGQKYTTNAADINYMQNYLLPTVMQLQGFRYGIPTTTQKAELPGQSTLSTLSQGFDLAKNVYDLYKEIMASNSSSNKSNSSS